MKNNDQQVKKIFKELDERIMSPESLFDMTYI